MSALAPTLLRPRISPDTWSAVGRHDDERQDDRQLADTFDEIRDQLFKQLYLMLGNHDDAQDALQVAFLRCWQARAVLPFLRNLKAWIWRVSLNAGRDLRARLRRRRTYPLSAVEATALSRPALPDALIDQEDRERLGAALAHLREQEKEVFLLRKDEGLTYREIRERRGIPIGTGKSLMHGAVKKLRQLLAEGEPSVC